jgi:hypothetical protein
VDPINKNANLGKIFDESACCSINCAMQKAYINFQTFCANLTHSLMKRSSSTTTATTVDATTRTSSVEKEVNYSKEFTKIMFPNTLEKESKRMEMVKLKQISRNALSTINEQRTNKYEALICHADDLYVCV